MTTLADMKARLTTTYYELVKIETSTSYYVTNAPFNIDYDGDTYESIGAILTLDQVESNMTFEVPKITIGMNGLVEMNNDGEYFIETMLGLDYVDRPVTIYRTYYDDGTQVGTIEVFKGFIDTAVLNYDPSGGCSVGIEIASHWVTFDKTNGRFTNSASQGFYTSANSLGTDTGLDNCDEVQKEITWKETT